MAPEKERWIGEAEQIEKKKRNEVGRLQMSREIFSKGEGVARTPVSFSKLA